MKNGKLKYWLVSLLAFVCVTRASVADYSDMYSHKELTDAYQLYSENLQYVWHDDFLSRLTLKERQGAPNARLNLQLVGAHRSPFDYYANSSTGIVTIPIMSVKFLDEIATAHAYLEHFGCRKDAIFDYMVLLRRSSNFPHISPVRALGIPSNALDNSYVYKTSGNALKSALYYIMAHEYAHVLYRHRGYDQITAKQAQAQEIEADNFALRVMNRIGVAPLGMVSYFALLSLYDSVPADFKTVAEYENYLRYAATHPLSSHRLINISNKLKNDPHGFARSEPNPQQWAPRILSAARDIEVIGRNLDDPKLRQFQIGRALKQSVSSLAGACL